MQVTLNVFSGRPNPTWELSQAQSREIVDRFARRALATEVDQGVPLGYRGFTVRVSRDDSYAEELPHSFIIGGSAPEAPEAAQTEAEVESAKWSALSEDETSGGARWLLDTARYALDETVRAHVEEALSGHRPVATELKPKAPPLAAAAACTPYHTAYNPGFWNNDATVRTTNNCYNYAVNYRTNTFAQPGRQCGHMAATMSCSAVRAAALCDGVLVTCSGQNRLVAMVIWPGVDYHWYRYHSNGFWGHKPGQTAARNTDNSGNVIGGTLNPSNCNRGPYTNFCGYFWVPTGLIIR